MALWWDPFESEDWTGGILSLTLVASEGVAGKTRLTRIRKQDDGRRNPIRLEFTVQEQDGIQPRRSRPVRLIVREET